MTVNDGFIRLVVVGLNNRRIVLIVSCWFWWTLRIWFCSLNCLLESRGRWFCYRWARFLLIGKVIRLRADAWPGPEPPWSISLFAKSCSYSRCERRTHGKTKVSKLTPSTSKVDSVVPFQELTFPRSSPFSRLAQSFRMMLPCSLREEVVRV